MFGVGWLGDIGAPRGGMKRPRAPDDDDRYCRSHRESQNSIGMRNRTVLVLVVVDGETMTSLNILPNCPNSSMGTHGIRYIIIIKKKLSSQV